MRSANFFITRFSFFILGLAALFSLTSCMPSTGSKLRLDPERGAFTPSEWTSIPAFILDYQAADGTPLKAWHWKGWQAGAPTLVYFHGPRGHMGYAAQELRYIIEQGHPVIIPEYRGYGPNEGKPTVASMINDAMGAMTMVQAATPNPNHLILMSHSVASEVVAAVATQHPYVLGVVPVSALVSGAKATGQADKADPAQQLINNLFNMNGGGQVTVRNNPFRAAPAPKVFIHGAVDNVMPYDGARRLFLTAPGPAALITLNDIGHKPSDFALFNLYNAILPALSSRNLGMLKQLEAGGGIRVDLKY